MAVYRIAMYGEPFDRFVANPVDAGLQGAAEWVEGVSDLGVHVVWPQRQRLNLIVEGSGDVEQFVSGLEVRLTDGDWTSSIARVVSADRPPVELPSGLRDRWVIDHATLPSAAGEQPSRRCTMCLRAAVPPHATGCALNSAALVTEVPLVSGPVAASLSLVVPQLEILVDPGAIFSSGWA